VDDCYPCSRHDCCSEERSLLLRLNNNNNKALFLPLTIPLHLIRVSCTGLVPGIGYITPSLNESIQASHHLQSRLNLPATPANQSIPPNTLLSQSPVLFIRLTVRNSTGVSSSQVTVKKYFSIKESKNLVFPRIPEHLRYQPVILPLLPNNECQFTCLSAHQAGNEEAYPFYWCHPTT
jgi:hypothetical protein